MWATIWPIPQPVWPPTLGGRHAVACGGSAATSRSVRRLTLSKNRRYEVMSVIMAVLLRELAWPVRELCTSPRLRERACDLYRRRPLCYGSRVHLADEGGQRHGQARLPHDRCRNACDGTRRSLGS